MYAGIATAINWGGIVRWGFFAKIVACYIFKIQIAKQIKPPTIILGNTTPEGAPNCSSSAATDHGKNPQQQQYTAPPVYRPKLFFSKLLQETLNLGGRQRVGFAKRNLTGRSPTTKKQKEKDNKGPRTQRLKNVTANAGV